MYNYIPIKSLKIKNFRNIGNVNIEFDSPIVTLVGDNEAGKTSVIKAFSTCALHANPRDQKDYIMDTTNMFGVEIELADGTEIVRVKENNGINLYRIIYPDKRVWDIDKITEGLPYEVSKLMGLIVEPETKEFLHIRTYEDKMMFVTTPASTNYKVMYDALKVEQLTKAIKIGSDEANALKNQVNTNELKIQTLNQQLKTMIVLDISSVQVVRDRLKEHLEKLDKLERLLGLVKRANDIEEQLGALALIERFNLQSINELKSSALCNVNRLLNQKNKLINEYKVMEEVTNLEEINTDVADKIVSILNKKNLLDCKILSAGTIAHVNDLNEINEIVSLQLTRAKSALDKSVDLNNKISTISEVDKCEDLTESVNRLTTIQKMIENLNNNKEKESNVTKINDYVGQVNTYLEQCGVAVETCPKCGESVIFDLDKVKEQLKNAGIIN